VSAAVAASVPATASEMSVRFIEFSLARETTGS
jgi:hypothetical protein